MIVHWNKGFILTHVKLSLRFDLLAPQRLLSLGESLWLSLGVLRRGSQLGWECQDADFEQSRQ